MLQSSCVSSSQNEGAPAASTTQEGQQPPKPLSGLMELLTDEAFMRKITGHSEDCVSALRGLNLPDDFWMYEFKVVQCVKTYSHKWTLCPCAHAGETARRRCPRGVNYKAVLCPLVKGKKNCPLGDSCSYSHNVFEHWLHPARYKTRLCSYGHGCNRTICFFAHSGEELRGATPADGRQDNDPASSGGAADGDLSPSTSATLPTAKPAHSSGARISSPGSKTSESVDLSEDSLSAFSSAPAAFSSSIDQAASQFEQDYFRHLMLSNGSAPGQAVADAVENAALGLISKNARRSASGGFNNNTVSIRQSNNDDGRAIGISNADFKQQARAGGRVRDPLQQQQQQQPQQQQTPMGFPMSASNPSLVAGQLDVSIPTAASHQAGNTLLYSHSHSRRPEMDSSLMPLGSIPGTGAGLQPNPSASSANSSAHSGSMTRLSDPGTVSRGFSESFATAGLPPHCFLGAGLMGLSSPGEFTSSEGNGHGHVHGDMANGAVNGASVCDLAKFLGAAMNHPDIFTGLTPPSGVPGAFQRRFASASDAGGPASGYGTHLSHLAHLNHGMNGDVANCFTAPPSLTPFVNSSLPGFGGSSGMMGNIFYSLNSVNSAGNGMAVSFPGEESIPVSRARLVTATGHRQAHKRVSAPSSVRPGAGGGGGGAAILPSRSVMASLGRAQPPPPPPQQQQQQQRYATAAQAMPGVRGGTSVGLNGPFADGNNRSTALQSSGFQDPFVALQFGGRSFGVGVDAQLHTQAAGGNFTFSGASAHAPLTRKSHPFSADGSFSGGLSSNGRASADGDGSFISMSSSSLGSMGASLAASSAGPSFFSQVQVPGNASNLIPISPFLHGQTPFNMVSGEGVQKLAEIAALQQQHQHQQQQQQQQQHQLHHQQLASAGSSSSVSALISANTSSSLNVSGGYETGSGSLSAPHAAAQRSGSVPGGPVNSPPSGSLPTSPAGSLGDAGKLSSGASSSEALTSLLERLQDSSVSKDRLVVSLSSLLAQLLAH